MGHRGWNGRSIDTVVTATWSTPWLIPPCDRRRRPRGPGQIARLVGGEEGDDLSDLLDLGTASEQGGRAQLLDEWRLFGRAEYRPGRHCVDPDARG